MKLARPLCPFLPTSRPASTPLLTLAIAVWLGAPALAQPQGPKVGVKLYAAQSSVQPGGQTDLAVELSLPAGWHMYHPINLDTGMPTMVDFELPAGATVGDLRFPIPTLKKEDDIEYLGLEGRPVILTTLKLAPTTPVGPAKIAAKVRGLVCQKLCVPVDADATLELKVSTEPPAPANEKLFTEAREALPQPLDKAECLEGSRMLVTHTQVPVGGQAALIADIRVKDQHHIQDRNPGAKNAVPARLYIESIPGVTFDAEKQAWPKPHVRSLTGIGRVRELAGEFAIQAPFEISDAEFKPGHVHLRVLLQYQCCTDAGECLAPTMAEAFADFDVVAAGAPAVKNSDPELAKLLIQAASAGVEPPNEKGAPPAEGSSQAPVNILLVFVGAFIGGAILNVTPCVLPVISLKIFSFMQQAGQDRGRILRMGLVYAAGILASFAVLAVLIMGARFAWGGLMQSPAFVIGLCAVVFAFALSLLGVFEIQLPGAAVTAADAAAAKEGYTGAFLNGVFATFLATPCVGPFLGSAVGLLTQMPVLTGGAGIMMAGLGLATPYVLLTAFPAWLRWLPKPGAWMITFKQILGFVLAVVVVWLLSVLMGMVGHGPFLGTLGLLCAVGLGAWILGKVKLSDSTGRAVTKWLAALLAVSLGGWTSFAAFAEKPSPIPWQPWEPGIAERLASEGYTVYVDYTATWCLSCQWNKKRVLETDAIAREFKRLGIYPIEADFTNRNPEMLKELRAHARAGVPLNIILPAGKPDQPIVLPELLTRRIVLDALEQAGPSAKPPDFYQVGP